MNGKMITASSARGGSGGGREYSDKWISREDDKNVFMEILSDDGGVMKLLRLFQTLVAN